MAAVPRPARSVFNYWRAERRTLRDGFLALLVSSGGDLLAGFALVSMSNRLAILPGLIVLIPAAIGMRGNIFGALGSRLGTGIHTGVFALSRRRTDFLPQNVYASAILTLSTSLFLGIAARAISVAFGLRSISALDFVAISIVGGVISSIVVGSASIALSVLAHRRGWDLDSVSAPIVTAIGDTVTLPALWAASFLANVRYVTTSIALIAGIACLVATVRGLLTDLPIARRIVRESLLVLSLAGIVDIFAGTTVESRLQRFLSVPALLVLLPPFLEDTGALGGILSARLSSKLHVGAIEPRRFPQALAWLDASINFLFAVSVFTLVGISAYAIAAAHGGAGASLTTIVSVSLSAGFLSTVVSSAIAYYGAIATYRFGLDPDNFGIPIVTSVMDLAGTISLVFAVVALGVGMGG